jgi:hypothetical protein
MAESIVLTAKGLYLDENQLSGVPEGALSVADNVVLLSDGVLEPRRGQRSWNKGTAITAEAVLEYLGSVVAFDATSIYKLSVDVADDMVVPSYLTDHLGSAGLRMRGIEFLKSLFFTDSAGISWLQSPDTAPTSGTRPGVNRCGDCSVQSMATGTYAWLEPNSAVGYRACVIKRSDNGFLMFGAPGGYATAVNTGASLVNATVRVDLPPVLELDTSYILQLYRTRQVTGTTSSDIPSPGEEMALVYEGKLTQAVLDAKFIDIVDNTPDDVRGAIAYWSPSQGGALQANVLPPKAADVEAFGQHLFAANTEQRPIALIRCLGVGDWYSMAFTVGNTIGIQTPTGMHYFQAWQDPIDPAFQFELSGSTDPATAISATMKNFCACVNNANIGVFASYMENGDDLNTVGQVALYAQGFGDYSVTGSFDEVAVDFTSTGADTAVVESSSPVDYPVGMFIRFTITSGTGAGHVVDGVITAVDGNETTLDLAGQGYGTGSGSGSIAPFCADSFSPSLTTPLDFDKSAKPNRLNYSKASQPYAFTLTGYLDVGGEEYGIKRIKTLGTTLFVFKEKGLWRLIGTDPGNFRVEEFDPSISLIAEDSIEEVDGRLYCLTSIGIIELTEGGKRIISRPIESLLKPYMSKVPDASSGLEEKVFSVGRAQDHQYMLFLPELGTTKAFGLCYSVLEQGWTKRTDSAMCGVELPDGRMVLGQNVQDDTLSDAGETLDISIERRSYDVTDYQDNDFVLTTDGPGDWSTKVISVTDASLVSVGDVVEANGAFSKIKNIQAGHGIGLESSVGQGAYLAGQEFKVHRQVLCRVQYSTNTSGAPSRKKHYRECSVLVRDSRFSSLFLGFASDSSPAYGSVGYDPVFNPTALVPSLKLVGSGLFVSSNPQAPGLVSDGLLPINLRTYVTQNHRRAVRLYVLLVIPVSMEGFSIEGVSVLTSQVASERTGR